MSASAKWLAFPLDVNTKSRIYIDEQFGYEVSECRFYLYYNLNVISHLNQITVYGNQLCNDVCVM